MKKRKNQVVQEKQQPLMEIIDILMAEMTSWKEFQTILRTKRRQQTITNRKDLEQHN